MQVEDRPIKKIKVKDRYRKDLGTLDELVESIKEKGVLQPITVDQHGNLLAGERRLRAAELAGLSVIPAVTRKISGDLDPLEIELYENIHRKDFLWAERAKLEAKIFELKSAQDPKWSQRKQAEETGGNKDLISRRLRLADAIEAMPELANVKTEDEAWKILKKAEERVVVDALVNQAKAKALKGVKIAAKNYIVGNVMDGMAKLQDNTYQFAEVDPPYAIELDKRKSRNTMGASETSEYTELTGEQYSPFITQLAQEVYRVLRDHSFVVWWYGMSWHTETLAILREVGFKVSDIPAIWYKGAQGQTASPDTMLGSSYEPFFVCRKGDAKLAKSGRSNVFEYSPLSPAKKIHPTEKPLDLMVEILETFTYPGQRLVVPLLGSGVTLRACYVSGRIGFGWDLSEEHKQRFLGKVTEEEQAGLYEPKKEKIPNV